MYITVVVMELPFGGEMKTNMSKSAQSTTEQIREQYEIEKELASVLRNADASERQNLYTTLYDEFHRRLPHIQQNRGEQFPELTGKHIEQQYCLVKRFIDGNTSFLEVGPGDCGLSLKVAEQVELVHAIDVSNEVTKDLLLPDNFRLVISDGSDIPVPDGSINLAYSNQLMEHLHPDDANSQLKNMYKALAPDGKYICLTPNKFSGPHDISKYFDNTATGFHLKEYSVADLRAGFKAAGFSKVTLYAGGRGKYIRFPVWAALACETLLGLLPVGLRKPVARFLPVKAVLGINLIGYK